jgi:YD repeat-containing protein
LHQPRHRAAYAYDPLGRRVEKSGTGVTQTYFLSDGTDEIAEYNGSGPMTTRYVPGPAIDEPIVMVTVSGGAKEYFHANHQGSVIAMTDASGAKIEGPYIYWRRRRRCGSRDRGMSSR